MCFPWTHAPLRKRGQGDLMSGCYRSQWYGQEAFLHLNRVCHTLQSVWRWCLGSLLLRPLSLKSTWAMAKYSWGRRRQNSSSLISWVKTEWHNTLLSLPLPSSPGSCFFSSNSPLKKETRRVFFSLLVSPKPVTKPGYPSAWSTLSSAIPIPT